MTKKERFDTFVKELGELTKKYDIEIWDADAAVVQVYLI